MNSPVENSLPWLYSTSHTEYGTYYYRVQQSLRALSRASRLPSETLARDSASRHHRSTCITAAPLRHSSHWLLENMMAELFYPPPLGRDSSYPEDGGMAVEQIAAENENDLTGLLLCRLTVFIRMLCQPPRSMGSALCWSIV